MSGSSFILILCFFCSSHEILLTEAKSLHTSVVFLDPAPDSTFSELPEFRVLTVLNLALGPSKPPSDLARPPYPQVLPLEKTRSPHYQQVLPLESKLPLWPNLHTFLYISLTHHFLKPGLLFFTFCMVSLQTQRSLSLLQLE